MNPECEGQDNAAVSTVPEPRIILHSWSVIQRRRSSGRGAEKEHHSIMELSKAPASSGFFSFNLMKSNQNRFIHFP